MERQQIPFRVYGGKLCGNRYIFIGAQFQIFCNRRAVFRCKQIETHTHAAPLPAVGKDRDKRECGGGDCGRGQGRKAQSVHSVHRHHVAYAHRLSAQCEGAGRRVGQRADDDGVQRGLTVLHTKIRVCEGDGAGNRAVFGESGYGRSRLLIAKEKRGRGKRRGEQDGRQCRRGERTAQKNTVFQGNDLLIW